MKKKIFEKRLINFWENEINKGWKHFYNYEDKDKIKRIIQHFHTHCIDKINLNIINNVLDWGCGGGLLTNEIKPYCKQIFVFDISKESIKETIRFVGNNCVIPYTTNNINIDLIICSNVIQHLTSFWCWDYIASIWIQLLPKYIYIQTKTQNEIREIDYNNYFNEQQFLDSLILTKEDIPLPFKEKYKTSHIYNCTSKYNKNITHISILLELK